MDGRTARKARSRERIIEAAARLLRTEGPAGFTHDHAAFEPLLEDPFCGCERSRVEEFSVGKLREPFARSVNAKDLGLTRCSGARTRGSS